MSDNNTAALNRYSPVYTMYSPDAFEFGLEHGMRTALRAHQAGIGTNFLADLSALRRRLFVGARVAEWLAERNITVSQNLFECAALEHGAMIVRIHLQQYLLIDSIASAEHTGTAQDGLFSVAQGRSEDTLVLSYDACEMACGGPDVAALMAELCPLDLQIASEHHWVPTRLAHCEVGLRQLSSPHHYRISCSSADARYLFGVLREVTLERAGTIIGLDDYRTLLQRSQ